jgi:hypothetical protein
MEIPLDVNKQKTEEINNGKNTMLNKEQERKVIFIIDNSGCIYLGYDSKMSMFPVEVVKHKNIYIKRTKFNGYYPSNTICRETMISYIIAQLSKNPQKRTINMLIIISKEYRDNLDKGVKLINHYEKLLKWNKTLIYDVNKISKIGKNEERYNKYSFVLVVIPNKWLYSPQLISLYLMFLKIAEIGFNCEFKTHKELITKLNTFFAQEPKNLDGFMSGFYHRVKTSYKYWNMFLHNLDTLYKNKTRKFNYNLDKKLEKLYRSDKEGSCKMYLDGISKLIMNKSCDKQLGKSFGILKKVIKNE